MNQMPNEAERRLPTRVVVLAALLVPFAIAIAFLTVFHWFENQPMSAAQYQSDPNMGRKIAARDDQLIQAHAFAQLAFVVIGAWLIPRRTRDRVKFLLVAVPVSVFVFIASYLSLIAG